MSPVTRPIDILTVGDIDQLMDKCSRRAPTGIRNRALIAVLYRSGIRISEALDLRMSDLGPRHLIVQHGKNDKRRVVGIDSGAWAILELWLRVRPRSGYVFCTLKGQRMHEAYVRELLPRLARRAGVEKRVHAHAFRHTHASELARESTPLGMIQAQLGHAHIATTSRYIAKIAPEELIGHIAAREWK